jgi:acyl-CoA thioester hydrolase
MDRGDEQSVRAQGCSRSSDNSPMAFLWRSRVRFVDTDFSTRIHYSALFRHFEIAETEFLRSLGVGYAHWFERGYSLPRVHVEADYLEPLRFDDEMDIEVRIARVGESSITLDFRVIKIESGMDAARGRTVGVCVEAGSGKSTPIPADIREALVRVPAE